jgi:hypothetical protein
VLTAITTWPIIRATDNPEILVRNAPAISMLDVGPADVPVVGQPTYLTTAQGALKVDKGSLVLNVRDYGAVGDGTTDDTAAIQAALDIASNDVVHFPPGTYKVTSLTVSAHGTILRGAGRYRSFLTTSSGDLLTLSGEYHVVEGLSMQSDAGGGHVVVVPAGLALAQSRFVDCVFRQYNAAKNVWRFNDAAAAGGGMFDCHWTDVEMRHLTTATVPAFYVYSTYGNVFSANRFTRCRAHSSGVFFFDIECDKDATFNYNNVWDSINFEICDGGGIKLMTALNTGIHNVGFFDNTATITGDLIQIGRLAGAPSRAQSRGNVITNYHRSGGTLTGGAVDIHLVAGAVAATTTIIGVTGPTAAGVTVDVGAAAGHATILGYDSGNVTINNAVAGTTVLMGSTAGLAVGVLTVNGSAVQGIVSATSAALAAIANAVNTANKVAGKRVWNTTTLKPVYATGSTAGAVWNDAVGVLAHTPV